jgi:hypothetical protein
VRVGSSGGEGSFKAMLGSHVQRHSTRPIGRPQSSRVGAVEQRDEGILMAAPKRRDGVLP